MSELNWSVQILTTEYLIEGTVQASLNGRGSAAAFSSAAAAKWNGMRHLGGIKAFQYLPLADGQITPTGNLATAGLTFSKWQQGLIKAVVAVIPNDDTCRQAAQKAFQDCKYLVEATVFAGPYCIRGTIQTTKADMVFFRLDNDLDVVPMQDAVITNQVAGAKLTGLRVPWLILHSGLIDGFLLA